MPPDQRPPSSGHLSGWRPERGPALDAVPALLAEGELTIEGRLPWSSNLTFLVTVGDAGEHDAADENVLQAVYKPYRGEQSLWDFPDGLYRREVAAGMLSDALGWGVVPPTVLRQDGPFGPGSLQLFVEADYEEHYFTVLEAGGAQERLQVICAFDVVANNADRKSGHVLVGPDGRLWGIDQGLCFHVHHKLRTVIWDFAGDPVPGHVVADLERLVAGGLPDELEELLSPAEAEALLSRAAWLAAEGTFPEPREGHPPYPWPLV
jgi:uncharacterized repeat protein (TIGR03843 family)